MFSHDALVGVKWKCTRGWRSSQALTAGVEWVESCPARRAGVSAETPKTFNAVAPEPLHVGNAAVLEDQDLRWRPVCLSSGATGDAELELGVATHELAVLKSAARSDRPTQGRGVSPSPSLVTSLEFHT
jgi:hypothetical protein